MEPSYLFINEAPTRNNSPCEPSLNVAEQAQQTFPSFSDALRISTTDWELPIFGPIPTRPLPSLMAEAGPSTTNMAIEFDTTSRDVPAETNQYTGPTQVTITERRRRRYASEIRLRRRRRQRLALRKEKQKGVDKDMEEEEDKEEEADEVILTKKERERRERWCRLSTNRRTREPRQRVNQAISTDVLADSLGNLSTDEPPLNIREENIQRARRLDRENQARGRVGQGYSRTTERVRQMNDVQERFQQRAKEGEMVGEEGDGGGPMMDDVQTTDGSAVNGAPLEESNTEEIYPRFPHTQQSNGNWTRRSF